MLIYVQAGNCLVSFRFVSQISVSHSNNGPSPGHSNFGMLKNISTACTIVARLISLFFPPILKNCENDLIHIICDCVYNVVKGNVPGLTQEKVNKLACHKTSLIKLTQNVPIKEKRKILVQKGGGFLPFLLPLVAPLIAKAVSKIV